MPQGEEGDNHTRENLIGITSKPAITNNDDEKNDNILFFWGHELLSICDRQENTEGISARI